MLHIMSMQSTTEFDLFFLSYDEPNAEENYSDLIDKAPWAKRVHGVKGFAAAHRACAEQSDTDWFVTVDADNKIRQSFFDLNLTLDKEKTPLQCYSWNARNAVNGLVYGNGGVKLWSKEFVLSDAIGHEATKDESRAVDFCWNKDYSQMAYTYSDVWANATPYQAFRAGFREGVKLTLNRGERVPANEMRTGLHSQNLRNLKIWCTVGDDMPNGDWSIYGALMGWAKMCDPEFDHVLVRDYDWFNTLWLDVEQEMPYLEIKNYRHDIDVLTNIRLPILDDDHSEFFREMLGS